jgi:membrane protease YdiL (CAAX protease family)
MRDQDRFSETSPAAGRIDWLIVAFFALAYLIAWGMIPVLSAIASRSGVVGWSELSRIGETFSFDGINLSVPGWVVYLVTRAQDFAFTIAGLVMIAFTQGRAGLVRLGRRLLQWRVRWYWYLLALLPFWLYFLAVVLAEALPSFQWNFGLLGKSLFSPESGLLVSLFLRGAMGEEPGLRGFALPRLQSRTTPFRAALWIGLLWGGWHLPVLLQRNLESQIAFLLLALGLSFLFTFLFNRSQGSLIPVLLFHGTQNAEEVFEVFFPALIGTDWELISTLALLFFGLVFGFIVWWGSRDGSHGFTQNKGDRHV